MHDHTTKRDDMQLGDWLNAAANIVIGIMLGIAIVRLGQLATTPFWPLAIIIPFLVAGFFLFEGLIDRLFDKIFPSGIRPARKPSPRRRAPLPKLLSWPVGIALGVGLDLLGAGDWLLGVI